MFLGPDEFGTGWEPQPKQELASELAGKVDELLFGGAAGGGKTEWLVEYGIREMERHAGNRGIIFRRVFPSLQRTIVPRARIKLHGRAQWNANEMAFTFPNGSVLELGALQHPGFGPDDPGDAVKYQGAEYGWMGFEEVTEFMLKQYEFMLSRLRAPVDGVRPHACSTTNPGGRGHKWVKERWVKPPRDLVRSDDPAEPMRLWRPLPTDDNPNPGSRVFVPATLDDNPKLLERDPEYVNKLRQISNRGLRKALETGDWDAIEAVEGALWEQTWLDGGRVHTLTDFDVNRKVVAVDPSDGDEGGDDYGVAVAAQGNDGVGYVTHSFGWSLSPRKLAEQTIEVYHDLKCDALVVERNHGGKWLPEVFRQVDRYANIKLVWASEGKRTRAEPVAALFEPQNDYRMPYRARMVGWLTALEEELTHFTGAVGEVSPNRLDAMVWALTELMLGKRQMRDSQAKDDRLKGRR